MPLEALAAAVQASDVSQALRTSVWLYPLVNTAHVVGVSLLFGAIVPLDLRLLGGFRAMPVRPLAAVLLPVATGGLLLALVSGALLLATRALDYLAQPLVAWKLALLGAALVNVWVLHRDRRWHRADGPFSAPTPLRWRLQGLLSILLWLSVITAGRWIGYR